MASEPKTFFKGGASCEPQIDHGLVRGVSCYFIISDVLGSKLRDHRRHYDGRKRYSES